MKNNLKITFVDGVVTILQNGQPFLSEDFNAFEVNLSSESDISVDFNGLIDSSLDTYMPDKGESIFVIDSKEKIGKAYFLLKEHVGEHEFNYCPHDFISADKNSDYQYYGKFDIENLEELYKKLFAHGIVVKKAKFIEQSQY